MQRPWTEQIILFSLYTSLLSLQTLSSHTDVLHPAHTHTECRGKRSLSGANSITSQMHTGPSDYHVHTQQAPASLTESEGGRWGKGSKSGWLQRPEQLCFRGMITTLVALDLGGMGRKLYWRIFRLYLVNNIYLDIFESTQKALH